MSPRKPATSGVRKKKLSLSKQTLKDLAPRKGDAKDVRGGAKPTTVTDCCSFMRSGCVVQGEG